ncbi:hypothetical protein M885DRAFT_478522 [Pelagophyceae sp. CCMP2097]|nr:hypothetical protein M885DRAFT_478522 [Pelagophyceae sp. CCMP2097]
MGLDAGVVALYDDESSLASSQRSGAVGGKTIASASPGSKSPTARRPWQLTAAEEDACVYKHVDNDSVFANERGYTNALSNFCSILDRAEPYAARLEEEQARPRTALEKLINQKNAKFRGGRTDFSTVAAENEVKRWRAYCAPDGPASLRAKARNVTADDLATEARDEKMAGLEAARARRARGSGESTRPKRFRSTFAPHVPFTYAAWDGQVEPFPGPSGDHRLPPSGPALFRREAREAAFARETRVNQATLQEYTPAEGGSLAAVARRRRLDRVHEYCDREVGVIAPAAKAGGREDRRRQKKLANAVKKRARADPHGAKGQFKSSRRKRTLFAAILDSAAAAKKAVGLSPTDGDLRVAAAPRGRRSTASHLRALFHKKAAAPAAGAAPAANASVGGERTRRSFFRLSLRKKESVAAAALTDPAPASPLRLLASPPASPFSRSRKGARVDVATGQRIEVSPSPFKGAGAVHFDEPADGAARSPADGAARSRPSSRGRRKKRDEEPEEDDVALPLLPAAAPEAIRRAARKAAVEAAEAEAADNLGAAVSPVASPPARPSTAAAPSAPLYAEPRERRPSTAPLPRASFIATDMAQPRQSMYVDIHMEKIAAKQRAEDAARQPQRVVLKSGGRSRPGTAADDARPGTADARPGTADARLGTAAADPRPGTAAAAARPGTPAADTSAPQRAASAGARAAPSTPGERPRSEGAAPKGRRKNGTVNAEDLKLLERKRRMAAKRKAQAAPDAAAAVPEAAAEAPSPPRSAAARAASFLRGRAPARLAPAVPGRALTFEEMRQLHLEAERARSVYGRLAVGGAVISRVGAGAYRVARHGVSRRDAKRLANYGLSFFEAPTPVLLAAAAVGAAAGAAHGKCSRTYAAGYFRGQVAWRRVSAVWDHRPRYVGADFEAACKDGDGRTIELCLVDMWSGLKISQRSFEGKTMLQLAFEYALRVDAQSPEKSAAQTKILDMMVAHRGDVNAQQDAGFGGVGFGVLHLAAAAGNVSRAAWVLAQGGIVDLASAKGETPLMLACASSRPNMARHLLECGAKIHATDGAGATPLHYAARSDSRHCCAILLRAGARTNARTLGDVKTPADLALDSGHGKAHEMIRLYREPNVLVREVFDEMAAADLIE